MKYKRRIIKLDYVHHLNSFDPDNYSIYCRRSHSVEVLDNKQIRKCSTCLLIEGALQGNGVECFWEDDVSTQDTTVWVKDPYEEYKRVDLMIKAKIINKRLNTKKILADYDERFTTSHSVECSDMENS